MISRPDTNNPFSSISLRALAKDSTLPAHLRARLPDGELRFPPLPVTSSSERELELKGCVVGGASYGRECAHKVLAGAQSTFDDVALLAKERQARVQFFSVLKEGQHQREVCAALQALIAADGPESFWFLRKSAFEYLRAHSSVPLTASLGALAATKDCSLRARILEVVMKDLSFPLSVEVRDEISRLGVLGGQLCNSLLIESPSRGERPRWVSLFPQFVRAWILAGSAIGIDHGVDAVALNKFSRETGGPLNDWQIRVAIEPLNPLSWGGIQAALRRLIKL